LVDSKTCKLTYCASRLDELELGKNNQAIDIANGDVYKTYKDESAADMEGILWDAD